MRIIIKVLELRLLDYDIDNVDTTCWHIVDR